MGYKKLSPSFVKKMNTLMKMELDDWSDNLVGKVKQELRFTTEIESLWLEEVSHFIGRFHSYAEHRNSFGVKSLDTENNNYGIQVISGWFVRQFENEYNPLHSHGGHISGVGYLKLPKTFGDTFQKNKKENYNGKLQLLHGSRMFLSPINLNIQPELGDFYFFPNYLMHCVYPFLNSNEERRSISFNAHIDNDIYNVHGSSLDEK